MWCIGSSVLDVPLVFCVLCGWGAGAAGSWALFRGAGDTDADAGAQHTAQARGEAAWGARHGRATTQLLRGLQLAGHAKEVLLPAPHQGVPGARGALCQDTSLPMRTCHSQVGTSVGPWTGSGSQWNEIDGYNSTQRRCEIDQSTWFYITHWPHVPCQDWTGLLQNSYWAICPLQRPPPPIL